ncbi:MAG TPA: hypothetical protein VK369_00140 [Segetibacter sp.]|nr:hypothetical protein [Segetibacter sp.]
MKQNDNSIHNKTADTTRGLIITTQEKQMLSKQQQTFNRLVIKIEKLRQELEQTNNILNKKLDLYVKHIYPLDQQLTSLQKEVVKILFTFFNNRKLLSKKQKEALREVIITQLSNILKFETGEPDKELKEIFKVVEGISYEEAAEEDFDSMKYEMAEMFEELGVDMDLEDMHSNMTQEEMIKKMLEIQDELKQQAEAKQHKRSSYKKTKKQLEKAERERLLEEARTKNISSIYRQLAKAFHPDLEQNEELKLEKEQLMKQLTTAYEKKDLHTLLTLEIAWIQKEETNPDKLGDEKLKIYNEVLKQQVQELEHEIQALLEHPRYQPLQKFAMFPHELKSINIDREKQQAEASIKDITESITRLKRNEKEALAEVKNIIEIQQNYSKLHKDFASFFS